jgi:hypothetical protein
MGQVLEAAYAQASDGHSYFQNHRLGGDVSKFFPTVLASVKSSMDVSNGTSRNFVFHTPAGMGDVEETVLERFE